MTRHYRRHKSPAVFYKFEKQELNLVSSQLGQLTRDCGQYHSKLANKLPYKQ